MGDEDGENCRDSEKKSANRREFGSDVGNSIFLLAFCAAGLGTTLDNKYRGDKHLFVVAFSFGIAYSGAEIIAAIIACVLSLTTSCCVKFGEKRLILLKSVIYIACSCTAFGLLVAALAKSDGIPLSDNYGCANGFGCANIMAIIACIGYGGRVIYIAFTIMCLFCCACSACCIGAAAAASAAGNNAGDEESPPAQSAVTSNNNNNNNKQDEPQLTSLSEITTTEATTTAEAERSVDDKPNQVAETKNVGGGNDSPAATTNDANTTPA